MKKSTKFAVSALILIGVVALSLLFLNNFLENKIKTGLEDSLKRSHASYDKVDVKLLDRKAEVINPSVNIKGKLLKVDTILLNDIHIWDYITKKDIIIGELSISNPVVKIFNLQKKKKDSVSNEPAKKFKHKIEIKNVRVKG
ncbi:MAG: hypothetical protein WB492_08205, partial [Christiangramia sp.]